MDGGNTPDITANEDGEAWYHFCKKGTYALICKTDVCHLKIKSQDEVTH